MPPLSLHMSGIIPATLLKLRSGSLAIWVSFNFTISCQVKAKESMDSRTRQLITLGNWYT